MHCLSCGTAIEISGELYCDTRCSTQPHRDRSSDAALPETYRRTLQALLDDRPVSRADAAGFFGWITRPIAA